jgi:3-(3-hydroxy-phenyl)propionate hydroxylase
VIGTDGARSAVRRALGFAFDGMTYEEKTILVTTEFRFEDHMPGLTSVAYCWNKDSNFSLLKVPGHWRVAYTPPPDMTLEEALQPDAIQRRLHDIIPRDGGIAVLGARGYTSHLRIVEHYRRGHIVLAGDAAHLHSSAGGTGMNGGIHDAFCLAEYLRAIFKDGADESVLDQYEARRRPVTAAEIIPLADANRKRMREKDPAQREKHLAQMQYICADRDRMKAYLMKISMLDGVRMAGQLLPASVGA